MPKIDVLTYGFALVTDQGNVGYSTVSLVEAGSRRILIDTGPASRRLWLLKALESRDLGFEDIDTVVLTHLHWDHCQNTDLFTQSRILVHPRELDYAKNPNRRDVMSASYFADMLRKLRVDPISDGDEIAEGVSIIDTPGHTRGHISIVVDDDGSRALVAGDAMPDGGTVRRGLPYNVFWDVNDASESVEKMLAASRVFYPGHDRPFRLEGDVLTYLHGPTALEVKANVEGGGSASLTYTVHAHRKPTIDLMQR